MSPNAPRSVQPGSALRFALLVFSGLVILQAVWIVSVPPFRGVDEFDHVFRADGVATGQWLLTEPAPDGRGLLVGVRADVAQAAQAQCADLEYTGRDNCYPVEALPDGRVVIATAAAEYHPLFYAVVGAGGRLLDGAGAVYAMRTVSALLFALVVALAALCWAHGGSRPWERLGFLVCLTPVLVYSSVMPAPNGLEAAAGLVLWCALLRLPRHRDRAETHLLVAATTAACLLATLRYLGPLWLLLAVGTAVVFAGRRSVLDLLARRRPLVLTCSTVVLAFTLAGGAWTLSTGFLGVNEDAVPAGVEVGLGLQPLVWVMQIVAAFPLRGDASHPVVYVSYLLVVCALAGVALLVGSARQRAALAGAVVVILLLPVAMTLATMSTHGVIWQGRYGLAFSVGLPLMASIVLRDREVRQLGQPIRLAVCGLLAGAHATAIAKLVVDEGQVGPSAADPAWLQPPAGLVAAVTLAGWCVLGWAALTRSSSQPGVEQELARTTSSTGRGRDAATP